MTRFIVTLTIISLIFTPFSLVFGQGDQKQAQGASSMEQELRKIFLEFKSSLGEHALSQNFLAALFPLEFINEFPELSKQFQATKDSIVVVEKELAGESSDANQEETSKRAHDIIIHFLSSGLQGNKISF